MGNVLGLIFANMHDMTVGDLTKNRTMGSVLFGGRYRLIDFPLSNMVNSGITAVGVITKDNYQSLLDHLGSAREWDLARKKGGLYILPPFGNSNASLYTGRIEALNGAMSLSSTRLPTTLS
jgi:glucose-1-phosphate adenylyltransferase